MRKKQESYLDQEAMKHGYQKMIREVIVQLNEGNHTESIKAVLTDRKTHIEGRLQELKNANMK